MKVLIIRSRTGVRLCDINAALLPLGNKDLPLELGHLNLLSLDHFLFVIHLLDEFVKLLKVEAGGSLL